MMLQYGREVLDDFEKALRYEWLEANGVGGFASSSILGINTRRYHGLLVASLKPPVARFLLLAKYEDVLVVGSETYPLSGNLYPGAVHPDGYRWLTEVRLEPFPIFRYEVAGAVLEKRLFLVQGDNTLVVGWELLQKPDAKCLLQVRPLIAFRDYHGTAHENGSLRKEFDARDGVLVVQPYPNLPALRFASNAYGVAEVGEWYRAFQYPREKERGLEWQEDLFCPLEIGFDLQNPASIVASTQLRTAVYAPHFRQAEEKRRVWRGADDFERLLIRAADQFIASRPGKTILAGYPWFTDWGRDTMISLPGLTLATGRVEVAKSILQTWAKFVDGGMLPNRFPDSGEPPEYNTVDAALWYFEAVSQYVAYTGDAVSMRESVYPALKLIVEGYRQGTRFAIGADQDGLIQAGPQLTWMDAVTNGVPATPRSGKAVEIQALWYNALHILMGLAARYEELEFAGEIELLSRSVQASFQQAFWNGQTGCFFDLVADEGKDAAIRPNQLFALSLSYPIAEQEQALRVLDVVRRELLTPYGLRTLSPDDPSYRGRYEGGPLQRDSAYHQGTVWPWLLGSYISAARRFRFETGDVLAGLREYALGKGCGQIPEIFDGDAPHEPRGCTAQAWSVAEVLRALKLGETTASPD